MKGKSFRDTTKYSILGRSHFYLGKQMADNKLKVHADIYIKAIFSGQGLNHMI